MKEDRLIFIISSRNLNMSAYWTIDNYMCLNYGDD